MSWMVESMDGLGRWALVAALVAMGLLAAGYANAQQARTCGPRAEILQHLSADYKEQPVALGLVDNGALLEILANDDSQTWTLLFSLPSGISCLIATGQEWQQISPQIAKAGAPI